MLVEDGVIARVGDAGDGAPEGARVLDLGGPHAACPASSTPTPTSTRTSPRPAPGAEPLWPGTGAHFLAADLRAALRMGITTIRDVGSYDDIVFEVRQAMRYGAFRGPRLLDLRADHLGDRARAAAGSPACTARPTAPTTCAAPSASRSAAARTSSRS